jgi:mRNA degradation ribonuclease J1/J2
LAACFARRVALPYALDFHDFKAWQSFTIGDFTITAYLVDHSAADA